MKMEKFNYNLNKNEDDINMVTKKSEHEIRLFLSNYLDNFLICFDSQTLNDALVSKHAQINEFLKSINKTIDDVYYFIPKTNKSFDLITYQYVIANDIDFKKVIVEDLKNIDLEDKVIVIMDDFSGTGQSLISLFFNYNNFIEKYKKTNVIFSPVITCDEARYILKRAIDSNKRQEMDFIVSNPQIKATKNLVSELNLKEVYIVSDILDGFGFYNGCKCVSFPYTYPDNNSGLGVLMSQYFIPQKNIANATSYDNLVNQGEIYGVKYKTFLELIELEKRNYKD